MSEKLLTLLEQTCQKLLPCLEEEFRALGDREFEKVTALAKNKQELVEQLEELDKRLHTESNIRMHTRWPALQQLLQKCRQQNEANGLILNRNYQYSREALAILTGHQNQNTLYGPTGLKQSTNMVLENIKA